MKSIKMFLLVNVFFSSFITLAFVVAQPGAALQATPVVFENDAAGPDIDNAAPLPAAGNSIGGMAGSLPRCPYVLPPVVSHPNTHVLNAICQLR